jgi:hypothetical protein
MVTPKRRSLTKLCGGYLRDHRYSICVFHCSHPEHSAQNHPQSHPAALSTPPTQHTTHPRTVPHVRRTDRPQLHRCPNLNPHIPGTPCSKALLCGNLSHLRYVTGGFVTNISRNYNASIFRVVQSEIRELFPL